MQRRRNRGEGGGGLGVPLFLKVDGLDTKIFISITELIINFYAS